jgi:hypothetical protein
MPAQSKEPDRSPRIRIQLYGEEGGSPDIHIYLPAVVVAVGAPRSGKTHMGRYLLYRAARYFSHGLVICPNPQASREWDCVQKAFISEKYSDELVEAFMEDQVANGCPPAFLILDDCLGEANFGSDTMKKLCTQYRKYNVFIWFGIQYMAFVFPPVIRQCVTVAYAFKTKERKMQNMLSDSFFASYFPNTRVLSSALAQLPKHHCFWLDAEDDTLNVVSCPSPEELPNFLMRWEPKPTDDQEEERAKEDQTKEDKEKITHHKPGELPDYAKRVEEVEKDRAEAGKKRARAAENNDFYPHNPVKKVKAANASERSLASKAAIIRKRLREDAGRYGGDEEPTDGLAMMRQLKMESSAISRIAQSAKKARLDLGEGHGLKSITDLVKKLF